MSKLSVIGLIITQKDKRKSVKSSLFRAKVDFEDIFLKDCLNFGMSLSITHRDASMVQANSEALCCSINGMEPGRTAAIFCFYSGISTFPKAVRIKRWSLSSTLFMEEPVISG